MALPIWKPPVSVVRVMRTLCGWSQSGDLMWAPMIWGPMLPPLLILFAFYVTGILLFPTMIGYFDDKGVSELCWHLGFAYISSD